MKKPLVTFGVIADCQYADKDDYDRVVPGTQHLYYNRPRSSVKKLADATDAFNKENLAFVVHLGDFTDKDLAGYDELSNVTERLKAPFWHVLGNHEYWGVEGDEERVLKLYGLEKSYYSKNAGGVRFLILDTNELGVIKHAAGSDEWKKGREYMDAAKESGVINYYDWNGGLGAEQMEWFKRELDDAKSNNQKVVLFAHHPVFPPGVLNAINQAEILDVIDAHDNVIGFINGHNHLGAYGVRKGIPYLTIPGIVNTDTNAYGFVEVYDDKLVVRGYGRVQDAVIDL